MDYNIKRCRLFAEKSRAHFHRAKYYSEIADDFNTAGVVKSAKSQEAFNKLPFISAATDRIEYINTRACKLIDMYSDDELPVVPGIAMAIYSKARELNSLNIAAQKELMMLREQVDALRTRAETAENTVDSLEEQLGMERRHDV